jgi:maltodextrin utilization protein YvdJ
MPLLLKTKKPLSVFLRTVFLIPVLIYHSHQDAFILKAMLSDNVVMIEFIY